MEWSAMSANRKNSNPRQRSSVSALRREMRSLLKQYRDAEYLDRITELVPTGMEFLGIRVPVIRSLARQFGKEHQELGVDETCELYDHCLEKPCREEILFVQELLAKLRRKFDLSMWERVEKWVDQIDNWEVCDQLSKSHVQSDYRGLASK